ncbi:hypothetical protein COLO4_24579 [Corchorus olitorius]|uniref:Uncharacterized protein n=1 Tax=Corchorus olitorius TaxID=93759 RepID=A0A1R3I927_9ROSI|nr:hypothetical protein COLO4_24579 [Corchorus olitorius]
MALIQPLFNARAMKRMRTGHLISLGPKLEFFQTDDTIPFITTASFLAAYFFFFIKTSSFSATYFSFIMMIPSSFSSVDSSSSRFMCSTRVPCISARIAISEDSTSLVLQRSSYQLSRMPSWIIASMTGP